MVYDKEIENYLDLLDLPYPNAGKRPGMPVSERAAQFSPFAALTGFEQAVSETARLTEAFREPGEDEREELDRRLSYLVSQIGTGRIFQITYFVPDLKKEGGRYCTVRDSVQKKQEDKACLVLSQGTEIPLSRIVGIEASFFE